MVTISALLIDPHRMTYYAFTQTFVEDILAVVRPVATLAAARAEVGAVTPDLVLFEPKVADGDILEALPLFAKKQTCVLFWSRLSAFAPCASWFDWLIVGRDIRCCFLEAHLAALSRRHSTEVATCDAVAVRMLKTLLSNRACATDVDDFLVDGVAGFNEEVGDVHVFAHGVFKPVKF